MRESSNCVEHTEKENFHFPIVPLTFLRLGKSQMQIYANIFGFLLQKTFPVPIFKVLASQEVILCMKNVIF